MDTPSSALLDLDAYFARIGYSGPRQPSSEVLRDIHLAHATHIPFENLDILLGRPIRIDLESLQAKLVRSPRGGYCFEQNSLLAAVLEQLGFPVTRLAARVRLGATRVLPRTHMLLKVDVDSASYIADVGFGAWGLLYPSPLVAGQEVKQFAWTYRVMEEPAMWVLQVRLDGRWEEMYSFTLEPMHDVDIEMANHYVSTYPGSRFVQTVTAQRASPEVRYMFRNGELTEARAASTSTRPIADDEVLQVLAEYFGLTFPAGTRFVPQVERLRAALGIG